MVLACKNRGYFWDMGIRQFEYICFMKYTLLFFFLMLSTICFATPPSSDILIYNGNHYWWTGSSPGHKYVKNTNLPVPEEAAYSSGNSDRITLFYTIENGLLYLTDIKIYVSIEVFDKDWNQYFPDIEIRSVFKYYFPNQSKILMDQYTRVQEITDGNILVDDDDNEGMDSLYEKYLVFEYKNGKVKKIQEVDYDGLKELRHKSFKKLKRSSNYEKEKLERYDDYKFLKEHYPKIITIDQYLEHFIFKRDIYKSL